MELFSIIILLSFILYGLISHSSKVATIGLLLLLYILFAFEKSIGDYEGYLEMFDEIRVGIGRATEYEALYVFSCSAAAELGMTFDQMRYVFCVVEIALIYSVIRKYTTNTALVLSLFFIFPALLDAELFRFLAGMSLVIYAFPYLLQNTKKGYIIYLCFVVLAALFHTSCWLFLIYYLLAIKNRKNLILIVAVILLFGTSLSAIDSVFGLMEYLPIREHVIEKYDTDSYSNMNGVLFDVCKQLLILSLGLVGYIRFNNSEDIDVSDCSIVTDGTLLLDYDEDNGVSNDSMTTDDSPLLDYNEDNDESNDLMMSDNALLLNSNIIDLNIISCLMLIPMYLSTSSQRLVHVIVFFNFIAIANNSQTFRGRYCWLYGFLVSVILLIFLLYIEGTGTQYALISHFTEGFIINLLDTI